MSWVVTSWVPFWPGACVTCPLPLTRIPSSPLSERSDKTPTSEKHFPEEPVCRADALIRSLLGVARSRVCQPPPCTRSPLLSDSRYALGSWKPAQRQRQKHQQQPRRQCCLLRLLTAPRHTGWVRQHTCTCNPQIPSATQTQSTHILQILNQLPPLLLPTVLPLSFFRQPASISRSPVSLVVLSLLMPREVSLSSFSVLSLLSLSSPSPPCSADLSPRGWGSRELRTNSGLLPRSRKTVFNSPDHNAVTRATQVLLAEPAVVLNGLRGEPAKRRRGSSERSRGREEVELCRTDCSSLHLFKYLNWMTANVWAL